MIKESPSHGAVFSEMVSAILATTLDYYPEISKIRRELLTDLPSDNCEKS